MKSLRIRCQLFLYHTSHSIIEPEAAGEVIAVKAVSGQDTTGNVAAQTTLTDDVDRLTLVQLTQPLPQLVHRDVKEPAVQRK